MKPGTALLPLISLTATVKENIQKRFHTAKAVECKHESRLQMDTTYTWTVLSTFLTSLMFPFPKKKKKKKTCALEMKVKNHDNKTQTYMMS